MGWDGREAGWSLEEHIGAPELGARFTLACRTTPPKASLGPKSQVKLDATHTQTHGHTGTAKKKKKKKNHDDVKVECLRAADSAHMKESSGEKKKRELGFSWLVVVVVYLLQET